MSEIPPEKVHETMKKYMLIDGYDLVYDMEKSHGSYLHDAKTDREFLDFFSCFATMPIGHNHPKLLEEDFLNKLKKAAINKPSNSDIYTPEMAEFVQTFADLAMPSEDFEHLFFISGGALAVENALKVAFDWKVRKNFQKGKKEVIGQKVLHFKDSFHGRTGYTLSLTNTFDPRKHQYFAKFDWPRVDVPQLTFPVTEEVEKRVELEEAESIRQINAIIDREGENIAALVIEPIQGEGGDQHFRPEFFKKIRTICDENEIMLVFDEVQAGLGLTGKMWAYQHYGITPDIVAFGKKTQVCGIMVSNRVDEVENNVFEESSRLNSTWGGNLVDMVRCQKYLEIIEEENLVQNAKEVGEYMQNALHDLEEKHKCISNVRGEGLMIAFDLVSTEKRDQVFKSTYDNGLLVLKSGERSIRFRPPLNLSKEEVDEGMAILDKAIAD